MITTKLSTWIGITIVISLIGFIIGALIGNIMMWLIGIFFTILSIHHLINSLYEKKTRNYVLFSVSGNLQYDEETNQGLEESNLPQVIPLMAYKKNKSDAIHEYTKSNIIFSTFVQVTHRVGVESEYRMDIKVLITLKIKNPVKFHIKTGLPSFVIDTKGKLNISDFPWITDIAVDVDSTFETLGAKIPYEEWKLKTDWTISQIIEKMHSITGEQDTLEETLREYGLEMLRVKTTVSLSNKKLEDAKEQKTLNIAIIEAKKALQEGKDKIIENSLVSLAATFEQINPNSKINPDSALKDIMIMLDEYSGKGENIFTVTGVGGKAGLAEALIATFMSKK